MLNWLVYMSSYFSLRVTSFHSTTINIFDLKIIFNPEDPFWPHLNENFLDKFLNPLSSSTLKMVLVSPDIQYMISYKMDVRFIIILDNYIWLVARPGLLIHLYLLIWYFILSNLSSSIFVIFYNFSTLIIMSS